MKRKTILGSLAVRLAAAFFCLWLLSMALLTVTLAGDIRRQASPVYAEALEAALEELREVAAARSLRAEDLSFTPPEVHFTPRVSLSLLRPKELTLFRGSLILIPRGVVMKSEGFDMFGIPLGNVGLNVIDGKLCISNPSDTQNAFGVHTTQNGFFLTFSADPLRKGSFPSAEIRGNYPEEKSYAASPVVVVTAPRLTDEAMMDSIDRDEWHFDSTRLLQGSVLRGLWLTDGAGEKTAFVVAAYGWDPLYAALGMLPLAGLILLLFFLLLGTLLWLNLRRTLVKPLRSLGEALAAEPLQVTELEYDCSWSFRELRDLLGPYLLRRQLQTAALTLNGTPAADPACCPELTERFSRAEESLAPMLLERTHKITREYAAAGAVNGSASQLEDVLLALFREAAPFIESGSPLLERTRSEGDFLLAELEVQTKHRLGKADYLRLWEGVYRSPADGNAPGAGLRRAVAGLPGSFAAVRGTKRGLVLTAGLPKRKAQPAVETRQQTGGLTEKRKV